MLTIVMAASILASSQDSGGRGPPPPPPQFHDHRYAYSVRPVSTTVTTEWRCEGARRPSMAKVDINSYLDEQRRRLFRVSLQALRVNGRPAGRALFERIGQELSGLEGITLLEGRCRVTEQTLQLIGSVFDGSGYTTRRLELTLTPER